MVVGVDEVGRGSWAGPVCVAAVVLDNNHAIKGLADSKKLSHERRITLATLIKHHATYVGVGWSSQAVIDTEGLTEALRRAAKDALAGIWSRDDLNIVLDGNHDYIRDSRVKTIVHGDQVERAISAASIVAKVTRDSYMAAMSKVYPAYGFDRHVGYGTRFHQETLRKYGACVLHRFSFTPIQLLSQVPS